MTSPNYPIAVQRAAPHGGIFRPAMRISNEALDEALCYPHVMRRKRQVDVNERISRGEPLPCQRDGVEAIDDPLISVKEVCVNPQVLLMRDLAAARLLRPIAAPPELDYIDRI